MPLQIKLTPGKVVTESDLWTVALLNLIANPTIELEGAIGSASIGPGAINDLSQLVDGLFSTPAGRAKFGNLFINTALLDNNALSADSTGRQKMQDGYVTLAKLAADARIFGGAPSGGYARLVVQPNAGAAASKVDVQAQDLVVKDGTGVPVTLANVNVTVDITVAHANGLDAGAEANSTWYYIWVIYDGTNVAGLLSTSSSAPDLSWGVYTYKALVGAVRNGGPGGPVGDFMTFYQQGNRVWTRDTQIMINAGNTTYRNLPAPDAASLQAAVPPIAAVVSGMMGFVNAAAAAHSMVVAADLNGLGACYFSGGGTTLVTNESAGNYRVPIAALPAQLYWKTDVVAGSPVFRIGVSGYEYFRL